MSDEFKFWTHGVNAAVESEWEGLTIRRTAWGMIMESKVQGGTWVHLPVPSATRLDDDAVDIYHAWLLLYLGPYTELTKVVVNMASSNVNENQDKMQPIEIHREEPPTRRAYGGEFGSKEVLDFDISDRLCTGPIVLSAYVTFPESGGEIRFTGAGARFEEHT